MSFNFAIEADQTDKGIDSILGKAGHKQSGATTEKISDGIRSIFKKARSDMMEYVQC